MAKDPNNWYVRDDSGRIIGNDGSCAWGDCPEPQEPGHIYCTPHRAAERQQARLTRDYVAQFPGGW